MLGGVWKRISAILGRDADSEEDDRERRWFVPSPLDISVRYAHGGSTSDVERELAKVEEKARELEEQRRGE